MPPSDLHNPHRRQLILLRDTVLIVLTALAFNLGINALLQTLTRLSPADRIAVAMLCGNVLLLGGLWWCARNQPRYDLSRASVFPVITLPALPEWGMALFSAMGLLVMTGVITLGWQWLLTQCHITPAEPENLKLLGECSPTGKIVFICGAVLLAPAVEEILFRGIAFDTVKLWLPAWAAALLVGCGFSALHGSLLTFPALLALSLVWQAIRAHRGNLGATMLLHGANNLLVITCLMLLPKILPEA